MKIILDCHVPAMLAHGGAQIQIGQTQRALQAIGVEAEFMRWWDAAQTGDLIHFFGRMPADQIRFAQKKGLKVVMAELLTASGSQNAAQRLAAAPSAGRRKILRRAASPPPSNGNPTCWRMRASPTPAGKNT